MTESREASQWSLRSWQFWTALAAVSCVLSIGNFLLTRSWFDGVGMALMLALLAVLIPGMSSAREPDPRWSLSGWRLWSLVAVCWLLYGLMEWWLHGSLVVGAGRAALFMAGALVLGMLLRRRRQ